MALSPKDRERIEEEEKLRFETRRKLEMEYWAYSRCGYGHRGRWWKWFLILALVFLVAHAFCWRHYRCGYAGGGYGCYDNMRPGMMAPDLTAPQGKDIPAPKK